MEVLPLQAFERPLQTCPGTGPTSPGEALAYRLGRHGPALPKPVKRGIADAAVRLYHERSLLKYDNEGRAVRFGDVIALTTRWRGTSGRATCSATPWTGGTAAPARRRRR